MPTKRLVPRLTTEGGIGTAAKVWGDSWLTNLTLTGLATGTSSSFLIENSGLIEKRALSTLTLTVADTEAATCYVGLWEAATGSLAPKTDEALLYDASTDTLKVLGIHEMGAVDTVTAKSIRRAGNTTAATGGALYIQAGATTGQADRAGGGLFLAAGAGTGDASAGGVDSHISLVTYKDVGSGSTAQTVITHSIFFTDTNNSMRIISQQHGSDFFQIKVQTDGVTELSTISAGSGSAYEAHLHLAPRGDVIIEPQSGGTGGLETYFKLDAVTQATVTSLRTESFLIAASDETTSLTTGAAKTIFRMPYAFTLTDVRLGCNVAPTGAALTVDISDDGTSIFDDGTNNGVRPTIAISANTSVGGVAHAFAQGGAAATATVDLADDSQITVDIDTVGSSVAGTGLKVTLIGHKTV